MNQTRTGLFHAAGTLLATSCALAVAAPAAAQAINPDSDAWQFEVTPYLWVPSIKGNAGVNNLPQAHVDLSPSDVIQYLDFFAASTFEARKDRWGLLVDGLYAKLADGANGKIQLRPRGPGLDVGVTGKIEQTLFTALGEYRVLEGPTPVDFLFGARYNKVNLEATVDVSSLGPLGLGINRSPSYSKDWVDPIVGVRVVHPIAERWSLVGYADAGGGGGSSSTSDYQAIVGANYSFSDATAIKFGYRYFHLNYDNGGFKWDIDEQGVFAGVGIKF